MACLVFVSKTIPTQYGRALASEPVRLTIPADPGAALEFAGEIDRQADLALGEGRFVQAERLSHLALEARCRATGARA